MPSTANPPKKTTQKPLINPPTKPLLSLLFFMLLPPFNIVANKAMSSLQQNGW